MDRKVFGSRPRRLIEPGAQSVKARRQLLDSQIKILLERVCRSLDALTHVIQHGNGGNGVPIGPNGESASHGGSSRISWRDLQIDPRKRLAYWDGKRLDINCQSDFTILMALVERPDQLVSYSTLLQCLDPDDSCEHADGIAPQEIKDAISHISRALRKVGAPQCIRHELRIVYCFSLDDE